MADFRRSIIVLAALALLLGTVSLQAAPVPFGCISQATNTQMRAEGLTEKGGDFQLTCTGGNSIDPGGPAGTGNPANQGPLVNVTIFLNTNVTSRILTPANGASEALLLVDEPTELQQKVCPVGQAGGCPVYGVGAIGTSPYLAVGAYNVFQGQWSAAAPNSIVFNGVPILPPGTAESSRIFRITNIRADANQFGLVGEHQVTETIATSNSTVLPISSNTALQEIGITQQGLLVTAGTATSFQQCFSVAGPPGSVASSVTLTKGFAAAFKIRNIATTPATPNALLNQDVPGTVYNTETFFYNNPALGAAGDLGILNGAAGIADYGTRFRVLFTNVNPGVTLTVPLSIDAAGDLGLTAEATAPTDGSLYVVLVSSESGGFSAATSGVVSINSSGTGEAVYEVLQANTSLQESITIPFYISYTANPGANSPALGTSQYAVSFAPISTDTMASAVDTIPRFADTSAATNDFSINQCATHLLFPFVTNEAGFDTGVAISNTSQDPYGTSAQTGTCTLNFYGVVPGGGPPPAAYTTPAKVAAGTTWANTISAIAAGLQGYVIADCGFQYAHGFAYITQVGSFQGATGYLALIIPDPAKPRDPNPDSCPPGAPFGLPPGAGPFCNAGSGEQLGQ